MEALNNVFFLDLFYLFCTSSTHIYPSIRRGDGYDIALLIGTYSAEDEIPFDIDPMPCLPEQLERHESCCDDREKFHILGYGHEETPVNAAAPGPGTFTLEHATIQHMDLVECMFLYHEKHNTHLGQTKLQLRAEVAASVDRNIVFCANDFNNHLQGICVGDTGGPMFRNVDRGNGICPELVGIGSIIIKDCGEAAPSGFTSVGHFTHWILKTIDLALFNTTWAPTSPIQLGGPADKCAPETGNIVRDEAIKIALDYGQLKAYLEHQKSPKTCEQWAEGLLSTMTTQEIDICVQKCEHGSVKFGYRLQSKDMATMNKAVYEIRCNKQVCDTERGNECYNVMDHYEGASDDSRDYTVLKIIGWCTLSFVVAFCVSSLIYRQFFAEDQTTPSRSMDLSQESNVVDATDYHPTGASADLSADDDNKSYDNKEDEEDEDGDENEELLDGRRKTT